ncbi:MAG: SBBP repeat-containing protein [Anaerolineales bacterium]|nr:SBBP repeat-containing protein [Anaerolineales bacterium]
MQKRYLSLLLAFLSGLCFLQPAPAAPPTTPEKTSILFIENVGQFDPRARFLVQADGLTLWLTDNSLWITLPDPDQTPAQNLLPSLLAPDAINPTGRAPLRGTSYQLTFPGATPTLAPFAPQTANVSYFTPDGNFPNVPAWGGVQMTLTPELTLELTATDGHLTLTFHPAAPDLTLPLHLAGADTFRTLNGLPALPTPAGDLPLPLRTTAPLTLHLTAQTSLTDLSLTPTLSPNLALIPDPTNLTYSTYLGGVSDDTPNTIAVSPSGEIYIAGDTYSAIFPGEPGQDVPTHYIAAFISKLDNTGTALAYNINMVSAGLTENVVKDIVVDNDGNAYVGGFTDSADFPATPGAYDTVPPAATNLYKAFAMKINASGFVVYATLLGTNTANELGNGIAVDNAGNAYLTGYTESAGFPTTAAAYDQTLGGERDAFVTKFNTTGSAVLYSTFLGGSSKDNGERIVLDASNHAIISGYSEDGSTFPQTGLAIGPTGAWDIFVSQLNTNGTGMIYSTVIGGSSYDFYAQGLALDAAGNAYVSGETYSDDFPTTPGAYDSALSGQVDPVVFKLNNTGTVLAFSTYLGGSSDGVYEFIYDLALDSANAPYMVGFTDSADFPTTPGAYQHFLSGPTDLFAGKLNPAGTGLDYLTLLGGTLEEYGAAIAVKTPNEFVITGSSNSANFPTTSNAFDRTPNGGSDGVVVAFRPLPLQVYLPLVVR